MLQYTKFVLLRYIQMKQLQLFFLILFALSASLFALTNKELAHSIDLAGKQRMLTQKMTKESLLVKSNIDKEENIKKLQASSGLFDKTLNGLINGDSSLELTATKDQTIQKQLLAIKKLWDPFYQRVQKIIAQKATDEDYKFLAQNNMKLLSEMNKAVTLYAALNKSDDSFPLGNDINLAGKERMLTQKMAKDLLFINNNFDKEKYLDDFKKSRALFSKTLNGLYSGNSELHLKGTKLPMITSKLDTVKSLWQQEQTLLDAALKGEKIKEAIAALDETLVKMNEAVMSYTNSLNRHKQIAALNSIIGNFQNHSKEDKKRVNLSGKQRMLTQRMSKLALLVSMGVDKKANSKKLIEYAKLYNQTLEGFKKGDKELGLTPSKNAAVLEQITTVESKWKPFLKNLITIIKGQDSSGKALEYIINNNEDLLQASNELVNRFVKSAPSPNFLEKSMLNVINVAGRQRMLTQKMTKEKLLLESKKADTKEKLQNTVKLFDNSLKTLIKGDANKMILKPTDKAIKAQLQKVKGIWDSLKPLYEKEHLSKEELMTIIQKNPVLLDEMNKMVNMAEKTLEY